MHVFEKILAYASLEDEAFLAIEEAASLARANGASLTVVRVLEDGGRPNRWRRQGIDPDEMRRLLEGSQRELLEKHYAVHKERPFFGSLLEFMSSGPVVALALRGEGAIAVARKLIGATNGAEAEAGTIRGDFGMSKSFNIVHGSDSAENAELELSLWFSEGTVDYDLAGLRWVYDPSE